MSDIEEVRDEGAGPDLPEVDPAILNEAAEQGWVPLDQWRGDPEEWTDAKTFVRRGREINPILRKALKKERERTASLEAELRSTGATVAELREYLAKVEERATKNALAQMKAQRREALAAGDQATADELEDQMDQLKDAPSALPKVTAPAAKPAQQHPDVAAWMARNPWYSDENPEMQEYADGVAQRAIGRRTAAGVQFAPTDILTEVDAKVRKMFPKHFAPAEGAPAAMFESGGSSSGNSGTSNVPKGAFGRLPREAQAQFTRFFEAGYYIDLKTKKPMDLKSAQAEYLKEYGA